MNKFVIIPEKEEDDLFNLLPLVTSIFKAHEGAEVNIIHSKDLSFQKILWPIEVKYHLVNEKNFGPVSSIKLAAQMDDLFNISHALTFRNEVGVLQFMKALKSKNRLGWKSLVNDVFFTESIPLPNKSTRIEKYLSLWDSSSHDSGEVGELYLESSIKAPENFFKESGSDPFLFISIEDFANSTQLVSTIENLLEGLQQGRVIIWESSSSESLKELKEKFPKIIDASEVGPESLHHYILRCRGFITNSSWQANLASFAGVEAFYVTNKSPLKRPFFKLEPTSVVTKSEGTFEVLDREHQDVLDPDALVNFILERYSL